MPDGYLQKFHFFMYFELFVQKNENHVENNKNLWYN